MFEDIAKYVSACMIAGILIGLAAYAANYSAENPDVVRGVENAAHQICQMDGKVFGALYEAVDDADSKSTLMRIMYGLEVAESAVNALKWNTPESVRHLLPYVYCHTITG